MAEETKEITAERKREDELDKRARFAQDKINYLAGLPWETIDAIVTLSMDGVADEKIDEAFAFEAGTAAWLTYFPWLHREKVQS